MLETAIDFSLKLLLTQGLLRDAEKHIRELEQENRELRNELVKQESC